MLPSFSRLRLWRTAGYICSSFCSIVRWNFDTKGFKTLSRAGCALHCSLYVNIKFYFCTLKTHECCPLPSSILVRLTTRWIFYSLVVCHTHKQELLTGFYQYNYPSSSLLYLSNDCPVFIFGKKVCLMQKFRVHKYSLYCSCVSFLFQHIFNLSWKCFIKRCMLSVLLFWLEQRTLYFWQIFTYNNKTGSATIDLCMVFWYIRTCFIQNIGGEIHIYILANLQNTRLFSLRLWHFNVPRLEIFGFSTTIKVKRRWPVLRLRFNLSK